MKKISPPFGSISRTTIKEELQGLSVFKRKNKDRIIRAKYCDNKNGFGTLKIEYSKNGYDWLCYAKYSEVPQWTEMKGILSLCHGFKYV